MTQAITYCLAGQEYYMRKQMKASIARLLPSYRCIAEVDDLYGLGECLPCCPDIILSETNLRDGYAPDYLKQKDCGIPVVFLSETKVPESILRGLNIMACLLVPVSDFQLQETLAAFGDANRVSIAYHQSLRK